MGHKNLLATATVILFCLLPMLALAYERPDAIELIDGWGLATCDPLVPFEVDRTIRPDFPQLSPVLGECIPAQIRANPVHGIPADAQWHSVQVPSAWEHFTDVTYNGAGWYRTSFTPPVDWLASGRRIWLEFDAVATVAGVWVNGEWQGGHVGDYIRWRVDITDAALADFVENSDAQGHAAAPALDVLVYVDELPGHITQGFLNMIAPHHGGIWQSVRAYSTGVFSIAPDGLYAQPSYEKKKLHLDVQFSGELAEHGAVRLMVEHKPPQGQWREIYTSEGDPRFIYNFDGGDSMYNLYAELPPEDLHRWSPDGPHVYRAHVWLPADGSGEAQDYVTQRFGFRDVEIRGGQLYINGGRIMVRSQLQWGHYPRVISPAPPEDVLREEFRIIKSLGFNAETVCLMNMPDYYYDLADEMGVLIWQEYPTWHNDFTRKHMPTYERVFPQFFRRDRNHPSIILRSMSVEAGVDDKEVMREIVSWAREMTDTPIQDNSSWFWLSDLEVADWYGEDNYWNNNRWAEHLITALPEKMDGLETKPYIIGETIVVNPWLDYTGLPRAVEDMDITFGSDGPDPIRNDETIPWWYPSCYPAAVELEAKLRGLYNERLSPGEDIVFDYLIPQSEQWAMGYRRFQIELMHADPRYAGYTLNVVRDIPFLRGGVIDYTGNQRYSVEDWAWHGGHTTSPVQSYSDDYSALYAWRGEWDSELDYAVPVLAMGEGYTDIEPLLADWTAVRYITEADLDPRSAMESPLAHSPVVITTVLTDALVDYMQRGGAVILLTSKWPGALGSYPHFFWRDAVFAPPVGPFTPGECARLIDLHQYDLNEHKNDVIPVEALGIAGSVDPMLRLLETHDMRNVGILDQLFATKVGDGLLVASSLDHENTAGQWVLQRLARFAFDWTLNPSPAFPVTELDSAMLEELAVARTNGIMGLEQWRFKLDEQQAGEEQGWMEPGYDRSGWDDIRAGRSWEGQGYSYDGMAWYVKEIDVPENWADGRITLVADGIDDAYTVWINGEPVETHGSFTVHEETVWLIQTTTDLTGVVVPGEANTIALQVVDIVGNGGVYKPIYLAVE